MKCIYLVKPGKSFLGQLTPKGETQMREIGTELSYHVRKDLYNLRGEGYEFKEDGLNLEVEIFHSPQRSATESAQIIAKYLRYAQMEPKKEAKEELESSFWYSGNGIGVESMVDIIKLPGVIVAPEKDLHTYLYMIGMQEEFDYSGSRYKKI